MQKLLSENILLIQVPYAEYILVMISYEQIRDEDKDIKPLLQTDKLIREYVKNILILNMP